VARNIFDVTAKKGDKFNGVEKESDGLYSMNVVKERYNVAAGTVKKSFALLLRKKISVKTRIRG
jgi:hypothetical protein